MNILFIVIENNMNFKTNKQNILVSFKQVF